MTKSIIPRSEATVKHNYTSLYMLTISKHQKLHYVLPQDIYSVIDSLKSKIHSLTLLTHSFERSGRYTQLHMHCLIQVIEFFKFKDYKSINGFHLKFRSINNLKGAIKYINKDTQGSPPIQDEILSLNKYTHPSAPNLFV